MFRMSIVQQLGFPNIVPWFTGKAGMVRMGLRLTAETIHCCIKKFIYDGSYSSSKQDMVSCQGPGERAKSGFPPSEDRSWGGLGLRLRLASLAVRQQHQPVLSRSGHIGLALYEGRTKRDARKRLKTEKEGVKAIWLKEERNCDPSLEIVI